MSDIPLFRWQKLLKFQKEQKTGVKSSQIQSYVETLNIQSWIEICLNFQKSKWSIYTAKKCHTIWTLRQFLIYMSNLFKDILFHSPTQTGKSAKKSTLKWNSKVHEAFMVYLSWTFWLASPSDSSQMKNTAFAQFQIQ